MNLDLTVNTPAYVANVSLVMQCVHASETLADAAAVKLYSCDSTNLSDLIPLLTSHGAKLG